MPGYERGGVVLGPLKQVTGGNTAPGRIPRGTEL